MYYQNHTFFSFLFFGLMSVDFGFRAAVLDLVGIQRLDQRSVRRCLGIMGARTLGTSCSPAEVFKYPDNNPIVTLEISSNLSDLFKNQLNLNRDGKWKKKRKKRKNKNIIPHRLNPVCPPIRNETVSSAAP